MPRHVGRLVARQVRHHPRHVVRRAWRALIIRVWGADPLRCPCCCGLMSKIGVLKKSEAVRTFLTRLGLWEGAIAIPPAHAPPLAEQALAWGVDAWDGRLVEFEPGSDRNLLPTRRLSQAPRESYRSCALDDSGLTVSIRGEAEESQVPRWAPPNQPRDDGLLLVFDGDPPPPDDLPVFWQD